MLSSSPARRWSLRSCVALTLLLAVSIVSGIQVAHWCGELVRDTAVQTATSNDGLCPICYSVPMGHGAAPSTINPICLEASIAVPVTSPEREGTQPEFHLHIRPPPVS